MHPSIHPSIPQDRPPAHHKLFLAELAVFVAGHGDGHSLLVRVVVAGLGRAVVPGVQAVRLLGRDRQHRQHQLLLPGADQVHHLLMGRSLHVHSVSVGWRWETSRRQGGQTDRRTKEGDGV